MTQKILFGILIIVLIVIIGFAAFMANFDLFDAPIKSELKTECDYEGLRKVIMTQSDGNATTNRGVHISVTDCNHKKSQNIESIFIVDSPKIKSGEVTFEWKNFDTLTIKYEKKLRILKQETESKTVNPKIIFEYETK